MFDYGFLPFCTLYYIKGPILKIFIANLVSHIVSQNNRAILVRGLLVVCSMRPSETTIGSLCGAVSRCAARRDASPPSPRSTRAGRRHRRVLVARASKKARVRTHSDLRRFGERRGAPREPSLAENETE